MTFDHDFFDFILLFPFPFLGGKRKGEKNNQSYGQKSCISARLIDNKICKVISPAQYDIVIEQI